MKILTVTLALAVLACAGSTSTIELSSAQIELDAFSGRPNPRWRLTAAEQSMLQSKLSNLPATSRGAVPEGRLGYRGFYIHDQTLRIQVANRLIVVSRAGATEKVFADAHGVEEYLLGLAERRGYRGRVLRN
jgi:hypothetical protein